jgi:branched-chain amino acid transport system permease protein
MNKLSGPLGFDVTAISFGIFGFFLLIMMVLRPEGFIPSGRRRLELHEAEIEGPGDTGAVGDFDQAYEVRQA